MGIFTFRILPPIGLDIGTNTFRAAQLKPAQGSPILIKYGKVKVPMGAVVEGEVVDVEAVSNSLFRLWKNAGFGDRRVVIGVANQKVVVRLIELPFMEKSELKGAIQYQAQEFIPIPIEEAILDFQVVGEFTTENNERMMEVLLVAGQKDMIQNNVAAVERAGLKPVVIDVSSFALMHSLIGESPIVPGEGELEGTATALINIGAGITNIVVVERGIPRFTRVTSLAGNDFTRAIADALNVSFDEAEDLKVEIGLTPLNKKSKSKKIQSEMADKVPLVQEVLGKEINNFVTEVRRSFDYYLAQATQVKGIGRVILSGGGSKLEYLDRYLSQGLQVDVEFGHPLKGFQIDPKLPQGELMAEEPSLAICLGLALRGFER